MRICTAICVFICALFIVVPITAQVLNENFYTTNGTVDVIAPNSDGSIIYIGGNFSRIGPTTGSGVMINAADNTFDQSMPKVDGKIWVVLSDNSGGWYIAGDFSYVGDTEMKYLAHILSDKTVDAAWNPAPDASVHEIIISGSIMYVGGSFTYIGGEPRNHIAALNLSNGTATDWNPDADGEVDALAISNSIIYAGGSFTNIGGENRNNIAALSAAGDGAATVWTANANEYLSDIVVLNDLVYVCGGFTAISMENRTYIAALNVSDGAAASWNPNADYDVFTLAVSGSLIYAGGSFTNIGGQSRNYLAALNIFDDSATSWNPNADDVVYTLAVSGSTIYAGGNFTTVGGQSRAYLAALSTEDGTATTWDPQANDQVLSLAVYSDKIYAGGEFTSINSVERNNIAAINASNGTPTSWNPNANDQVRTLIVSGSTIYAGGSFTTIGGASRNNLAALYTSTGNAYGAINPSPNSSVYSMVLSGTVLYVGGNFTSIASSSRNRLAAISTVDGSIVSGWDANIAGSNVYTLYIDNSTLFIGGGFSSVGSETRNNLAAVTLSDGTVTSWDPNANSYVTCLVISNSMAYVGGNYSTIGGQNRNNLAAVNTTDGLATDWDPNAEGEVKALVILGSTLYAGGYFTTIDGQNKPYLAAVDINSGNATSWYANISYGVRALALYGTNLYVGGEFKSVLDNLFPYFAVISTDQPIFPTVETSEVSNIATPTAHCGGEVTDRGQTAVIAYGVCWSTSTIPTIVDNHTTDGSGTGAFSSTLTDLDELTTYYVRAYATNSDGTSYGEEISFSTLNAISSEPGTALNFDGTDDFVSIPDQNALDLTSNYTIEAWIKPETFGASEGIVSKYQTGGSKGFVLRLGNIGNYRGLSIDELQTADNILTANKWYHVAAVNDNGTRHLYLNGVEQNLTGTVLTVLNSPDPLCIGRDFGERYFDGSIDEVRIWNEVRTEQELRNDMYRTLDIVEDYLLCYWQFNDGSGSNLKEINGEFNGTLNNTDVSSAWVTSTIPVGGATSSSINSFSSGTTTLENVTITTTNDFDNEVNLVNTEISRSPNTNLPSGITLKGSRYFVINCFGTPDGFSVNLQFTLGASILDARADTNPGGVKLYRRDSNSDGDWTFVASASSANSTTGEVTFTEIASFSQFAIGEDESALPVELTSFSASTENNKAILKWKTATEVNNYGFSIERNGETENGGNGEWIEIGFVLGSGNSNSPKEYSFIDELLTLALNLTQTLKYRLKQVDTDGLYKYSDEVEVTYNFLPTEFKLFQNYPNPFNPVTKISWQSPVSSWQTLKVYDILGNEIATLVNEEKNAGRYEILFSAKGRSASGGDGINLSSGIYYYQIRCGKLPDGKAGFVDTKKFILIK